MASVKFGSILLVMFCTVLKLVGGHSWLACVDYMEKNAHHYDPDKCRGYPRAANTFLKRSVEFGTESGYDHEPSEQRPCRVRRDDHNHYDSFYPMAVYYPGQQVVLAHPMKEHGADADCTNPYIPDTGSWIFRGDINGRRDPTLTEFRKNMVFDLSTSPLNDALQSRTYPKPGFQNAPAFCLNQDKSLGTYSFNVPLHLQPGLYTFMWLWAFNNMDHLFSTCFEVHVVRDQIQRNRLLRRHGFTNFTEPCGGMTSNPEIRGVCNTLHTHREHNRGDDPGGSALVATYQTTVFIICLAANWIIH